MKKLLILVIMVAITLISGQALALVKNATRIYYNTDNIWGARSDVTFREPDLRGGNATYHRVIIYREASGTKPERFLEWGWAKGSASPSTPYINNFGMLMIYGTPGSSGNTLKVFLGITPKSYNYNIIRHKDNTNPNCPGEDSFHTLGYFDSGTGYLMWTVCKSATQFGKGDSMAWGGEVSYNTVTYLPDMVGASGSGRRTNMYSFVQWFNASSTWIDLTALDIYFHRDDCPYRVLQAQQSSGRFYFDVCGVEDGTRTPANRSAASGTCPLPSCTP